MNQGTLVRICLMALAAVVLLGAGVNPALAAKGGGGKVSVTAAEPGSANQGEQLEVTISGDGFDDGSEATFFITGTSDASQIIVDSTTYDSATGKLKASIRVNGAAQVADYDIEVRNSRGRRGKGTTLFKVQSVETACTGFEPKEPEIAYLTALKKDGEYETQDLYLSSASGCDRYLLLEDAAIKVPGDVYNGQQQPGPYLAGVRGLRLDIEGDQGVVTWRNEEIELDRLYALRFTVYPTGVVAADASGPSVVYVTPSGAEVQQADVRINGDNQLELLVLEGENIGAEIGERRLVSTNVDTLETTVLMAGSCPAQDATSKCYMPDTFRPWWNEDGTAAFINLLTTDYWTAIGRLSRVEGVWQPAQVLMADDHQVSVKGIRSDGLMAYTHFQREYHRNGRVKRSYKLAYSIDPAYCDIVSECIPADGTLMSIDTTKYPMHWTRSGGFLFLETGPGVQRTIREYTDPLSGTVGSLEIQDVDRDERDTTF